MERNLDRRVEAVVPVEDAEARARIAEIIEIMLADDRRSWQLGAGRRLGAGPRSSLATEGTSDTFEELKAASPSTSARDGRDCRAGRAPAPARWIPRA